MHPKGEHAGTCTKKDMAINGGPRAKSSALVEAGGICNRGEPDWHVCPHCKILIKKMMPTKKGCPFNCA